VFDVNKQTLTLSIIIPVYNEQSHLKKCLKSIADQSDPPDEVIVIDNNSTDDSAAIAASFPFVRLITETRQGVLFARNTGFSAAASDIIGRIDADTILERNWCKNVRHIFGDKRIGAATGPVMYYDMPFKKAGYHLDNTIRSAIKKVSDNFPFLFGTNMAIRRSIWDAYKDDFCTTKDIHEDLDMAIHLAQANVMIAYRPLMVAGMSARRYDDKPKDFYRYISYHKTTFKKHGIDTNTPNFAMATFIFGYFLLKPLRIMYDPVTTKFSLNQVLKPKQARKNPMD
jgi:glycosyltransferase involved in cell wall biosynthesis